jgi:MoxR-vWA-beta-propeller ternary system domain bpX2
MPLATVELFALRDGKWFRSGRRLPSPDVPSEEGARPLSSVLTPSPVTPLEGGKAVATVSLTLVRAGRPRPVSALMCELRELARWADGATSQQIEALVATRWGEKALVRGERLPTLAASPRWWGRDVLVPLGFRPEPDLAEEILRQVMGLGEGDVALLTNEGADVVPAAAFGPVSRAGIRLAVREKL